VLPTRSDNKSKAGHYRISLSAHHQSRNLTRRSAFRGRESPTYQPRTNSIPRAEKRPWRRCWLLSFDGPRKGKDNGSAMVQGRRRGLRGLVQNSHRRLCGERPLQATEVEIAGDLDESVVTGQIHPFFLIFRTGPPYSQPYDILDAFFERHPPDSPQGRGERCSPENVETR
jgi:hypothetical protein